MQSAIVLEESSSYESNNYVKAWKMLIQEMFNEFIHFFAPDIYDDIDLSTPPQFILQEQLHEVLRDNPNHEEFCQLIIAKRFNDKEKWILVHFDFNENSEELFRRRMFHYFYRIYDQYDQKIYPIAILHQKEHARLDYYDYHYYDTSLIYKYNAFIVMEQELQKLEKSSNPFAVIIQAIIYSTYAKEHILIRFFFKRSLIIHVLKRFMTLNEKSITTIFYFIDIVLPLPDSLEHRLRKEINKIWEETK